MRDRSATLNVWGIDACLAPNAEGGKLVIQGERAEVVTAHLSSEAVLGVRTVMEQLALDLQEAQMLMGKLAALRAWPSGTSEKRKVPVSTPLHFAEDLKAIRTAGRGCLLEVRAQRGEHFRIALQADQAGSLLAALLGTAVRRMQ
jgi:hypothetical protein